MKSKPCNTLSPVKNHSPNHKIERNWIWVSLQGHESYRRLTTGSTPPTLLRYFRLRTSANCSRTPTTCRRVTKLPSRSYFLDRPSGSNRLRPYTSRSVTAPARTFTMSGHRGQFSFSMAPCRSQASPRHYSHTLRQGCGRLSRMKVQYTALRKTYADEIQRRTKALY